MSGRSAKVVVAASGLVVGLAVAAAMIWSWSGDGEPGHDEAAEAFVDAWERSRTATFVVRSDFHRETTAGGELDSEVLLVQRPPDHLVHQFGSVEGRLDGRQVGCSPDPAGQTVCRPAGPRSDTSYDETVAREIETFGEYVFGDAHPLYRVRADGDGCYDLRLTRLLPSAPYGDEARFCFDDETGAITFIRIERSEGIDVTEMVEIRTDVRETDFQLTP
jgi:hypothetical protein